MRQNHVSHLFLILFVGQTTNFILLLDTLVHIITKQTALTVIVSKLVRIEVT